jgi:signal transduction histidine kinase/ligand-binding sensor domain-containing protein
MDDKFELMDSPPGLAGRKIQALANDQHGQIWVGTEAELASWQNDVFTNLGPGGVSRKISVRRIIPTKDGLWLEANNQLSFFDQQHWKEPLAGWNGKQSPWSHVRAIRTDNAGGIWFSLTEEGLAHVDRDGKLVRVTTADGLPSQLAQAFFCDREGNLWAGYHRGGLVQLRQQTFHSVGREQGLLDTLVTSVTEDKFGGIWMGTAGGSVVRYADGECENLNLPLLGAYCQDVVVCGGPDGRMWIGTGGNGLLVWENAEFRHVILPDQLSQGVRLLQVARNGSVWFANFSGVYQMADGQVNCVVTNSKPEEAAASLAEAADGSIWFGTFNGLLRRWQNGKLMTYQPGDAFPVSRIWSLLPESDGTIWAGTINAGLLRFKEGKFTRYTKADGLADNYISHILADKLGNLWLASGVGVMCVSKKSLDDRDARHTPVSCRLFGRSDGLPTVAMTLEFQPSCIKTHDGTLWFGTPKGAAWLRPDDLRSAEPAPKVLAEKVLADRQPREFDRSGNLPVITLQPGEKYLDVAYTAPNFVSPDLLRFKYRLSPLDSDWVDAGSQRTVSYNHLSAGEYTFQVTAGNADGVWSADGARFRIVVRPHFWERKSFQLLTAMLLLAAVVIGVRRASHQRLRRRLETLRQQQQVQQERARIAQDLHDDLGAGLTEISLTSDFGKNLKSPAEEAGEYFKEIGSRARELVQRLDEIVWAVNPRNDSINSLTIYVCEYTQHLMRPVSIACRFELQPDLPELNLSSEQRYSLFLAFKETVNNVARHSQATELHLRIFTQEQKLYFEIADNGTGFADGVHAAGADGLRNIRQRIERLDGKCEITSQLGQGTRVSFWIPFVIAAGAETKMA